MNKEGYMRDVLIFNVDTMTTKQVTNTDAVMFIKLDHYYSQSIMVRPGLLVALLHGSNQ